jgi:hypothetical protein
MHFQESTTVATVTERISCQSENVLSNWLAVISVGVRNWEERRLASIASRLEALANG